MTTLRSALKGAAIALALAGTALAASGGADAQTVYYGNNPGQGRYDNGGGYYNGGNGYDNYGYGYNRYDNGRYGYGRDGGANVLSLLLGTIAFGYRDGYWDTRHHWHHWRTSSDYQYYRDHGTNYYGNNHDSYDNGGWQPY